MKNNNYNFLKINAFIILAFASIPYFIQFKKPNKQEIITKNKQILKTNNEININFLSQNNQIPNNETTWKENKENQKITYCTIIDNVEFRKVINSKENKIKILIKNNKNNAVNITTQLKLFNKNNKGIIANFDNQFFKTDKNYIEFKKTGWVTFNSLNMFILKGYFERIIYHNDLIEISFDEKTINPNETFEIEYTVNSSQKSLNNLNNLKKDFDQIDKTIDFGNFSLIMKPSTCLFEYFNENFDLFLSILLLILLLTAILFPSIFFTFKQLALVEKIESKIKKHNCTNKEMENNIRKNLFEKNNVSTINIPWQPNETEATVNLIGDLFIFLLIPSFDMISQLPALINKKLFFIKDLSSADISIIELPFFENVSIILLILLISMFLNSIIIQTKNDRTLFIFFFCWLYMNKSAFTLLSVVLFVNLLSLIKLTIKLTTNEIET